jgi:Protein of unknown function (DUF3147)
MMVHVKWSALRQSRWYEYVLRFVLGGVATLVAGLVAEFWGPEVGGLFLAFPAIFCASATLVETHERKRKRRQGLNGERRGTDAAALDAAGAVLGSVGLAVFAVCAWKLGSSHGFAALLTAAFAWLLVSVAIWRAHRGLPRLGQRTKQRRV